VASGRAARVLLLTGAPGTGKTTVVRRVAAALGNDRLAGFYTEEVRAHGTRRGFRLVTFDGRHAVIADVGIGGGPRVGKYGVDVAAIEGLGVTALAPRPGADTYLVDEIGKMECLSPGFVSAVRALLDGPGRVVATVARRGGGFIAEVRQRPDVELWTLTRANRDEMAARVLAWLEATPSPAGTPAD
jgi:nucleoside-triphosphatase